MKSRFVADMGPGQPRLGLELIEDEITIGRDPACTICLEAGGISRIHARLVKTARGYMVLDQSSVNGVFVNGERVSHHLLVSGDIVRLGTTDFTYTEEESLDKTVLEAGATARLEVPETKASLRLRVESSPVTSLVDRELELSKDEITLGRDSRNDIAVPDKKVSRLHARILREGGKFFLLDNQSGNGTFLRGARIEKAEIVSGDVILIGETVLEVLGGPRALGDQKQMRVTAPLRLETFEAPPTPVAPVAHAQRPAALPSPPIERPHPAPAPLPAKKPAIEPPAGPPPRPAAPAPEPPAPPPRFGPRELPQEVKLSPPPPPPAYSAAPPLPENRVMAPEPPPPPPPMERFDAPPPAAIPAALDEPAPVPRDPGGAPLAIALIALLLGLLASLAIVPLSEPLSRASGISGAAEPVNPRVLAALAVAVLFAVASLWIFLALVWSTLAVKTGTRNPWMAWIPILNAVLLCRIARRPAWWVVLLFIPLVNIVVVLMIWMAIARLRGKPVWLGILTIVPVAGFFAMLALAAGPAGLQAACQGCGAFPEPGDLHCGACGTALD
ncbi:MAG: FHA domain-containing protein [Acidobacteria bacterium]|nr:FHA domain-containing protein [Acidobacteriota bacterium]